MNSWKTSSSRDVDELVKTFKGEQAATEVLPGIAQLAAGAAG